MTGPRPEDLIDLARYPLHEREGAGYRILVRAAKGRLAEDGAPRSAVAHNADMIR